MLLCLLLIQPIKKNLKMVLFSTSSVFLKLKLQKEVKIFFGLNLHPWYWIFETILYYAKQCLKVTFPYPDKIKTKHCRRMIRKDKAWLCSHINPVPTCLKQLYTSGNKWLYLFCTSLMHFNCDVVHEDTTWTQHNIIHFCCFKLASCWVCL